jgi:hypothetical protein
MTWFAHAIGGGRLRRAEPIREAIDALAHIRDRLAANGEPYWAEQVEIERRGATAWLAFAEGRTADAVREMRAAADREDATEKNAMTPGPLAPARELLAEMLRASQQPAAALTAFEATLKKEPNRFRAIAGAAGSAAAAGKRQLAATYYQALLKICADGDAPGRAELVEARRFVTRRAAR